MAIILPTLPTELYLKLFSHLLLRSLIASRRVSHLFRTFIAKAPIPPSRRAFLTFYLSLIASPYFHRTRPWVLENLKPFDRAAYLSSLIDQGALALPEQLSLWILVWSSKAAIGAGAPGRNALTLVPPPLSAAIFLPYKRWIQAICLFTIHWETAWLAVDEDSDLEESVRHVA
ncbi:hypothetical protein M422DRAFT_776414 [Sphaerobolus stellatus SS14]|nr:hypothetical protein M422DRAFT_776414 [Sphaerobolus stellatus SS14]